MTWTAPEIERRNEPYVAAERAMLEGWLDYHRDTLLFKCQGLTVDQLRRRSAEPSSLSLLGLVRHMADVERGWFRRRVGGEAGLPPIYRSKGNPDGEFDDVDSADAEADFATFLAEVELAKAAAGGHALDETFRHERTGAEISVRWVYVHMIEEYARHNGHADLIRERIDGMTGE
ncbi:DinB family protein [Phytohabitans sp. ZYX-F-186]|uniref:DinB family protein n=1 Tax=Phytohabitans maris TaxID=3071409 RepID=A0ABU0ZV33_9ACTN|nr:DinB family protein [Phytohabitans sp. ZYX-F-186]MDQ7910904.1 DinB family protein [Phytohabitans sp. ZYX-F-186]